MSRKKSPRNKQYNKRKQTGNSEKAFEKDCLMEDKLIYL